jgi:hypothetical protein
MSSLGRLRAAAKGLAYHPQDHGWRDLYGLFHYGLKQPETHLQRMLLDCYEQRPISATHLLTLLGIALKMEAGDHFTSLTGIESPDHRLRILERILQRRAQEVRQILMSRQNSFTCARRFLVPRVILSAFFSQHRGHEVRFADLGTGLGILPRQINSRSQYQAFSDGLIWPGGVPEFRELKIASAFGVDRGPMPDSQWVRACYGRSTYYSELYGELQSAMSDPEVKNAAVEYVEIDLLNIDELVSFIRQHKINSANLSYVLYELDPASRERSIEVLVQELFPPALLIVTEPREELHREGCIVEAFCHGEADPSSLFFISDGHFNGYALPLDDYDSFVNDYPISYVPKWGLGA